MKKLLAVLVLGIGCVGYAHASDARVDEICADRNINKQFTCVQVISEEIDAAYMMGEANAHLFKREKKAKLNAFLISEPMVNLCTQAPDAKKCALFREYLVEEYTAGIGLDAQ